VLRSVTLDEQDAAQLAATVALGNGGLAELYIYIYICMYIYVCMFVYTHTHTHTHTHIPVPSRAYRGETPLRSLNRTKKPVLRSVTLDEQDAAQLAATVAG